jgi:surface antigen
MEDMKLLKAITVWSSILLFLTSCSTGTVTLKKPLAETNGSLLEMPTPMYLGDNIESMGTSFLFNATQYLRFSLNKEEKQLHESAVFFMLDNARNGEIVSWYSKKRLVNGKVRVIHSYPTGQGLCRTYQAYIKVNGTERHMTNNACKKNWNITWAFYK